MTKDEHIAYWAESSEPDFRVMESLYENSHYVWSLFVGHLVVEKLLKAYHVKHRERPHPRTHKLLLLAATGGLELTEKQKKFLVEITAFNIRARYPDQKRRFYKTADREFAAGYIAGISEFRQWLLHTIAE